MNTLFYWSELTDCIRSNDVETMLQRETCQLISKYCRQFNLDDDVEFACYEFAHKHFQNVEQSIAAGYKCVGVEPLLVEQNLEDYVQTAMLNIEMDLPLHLFAIISITAKYFGAKSWSNTYRMLPNLLQTPDRIVSFREIYHMEFRIFRSLNFSVSSTDDRPTERTDAIFISILFRLFQITPSAPYERVQTILEYCSERLQTDFRQLHDTCNALLRFTYIERHIIYKR